MAHLICEQGSLEGQRFEIEEGLTVGRGPHNRIAMPKNPKCSRDHAKVWKAGATQYAVADLGSTNGTLVNDEKITRHNLKDGDTIQIGTEIFRFELGQDEKPKPKVRAAADEPSLADILRGDAKPKDRPIAAGLEGAAAIEIKQRILQYNKKSGGGGALSWDMSQTGGPTRLVLVVLALALFAGLFLLVKNVVLGARSGDAEPPAVEDEDR